MKMIKNRKKGFTLIELMIVVAIIGILAAIAIPQFANLIAKSQEGATKGNLGSIRSALSIYYGDSEGVYPTGQLDGPNGALTANQKYMQGVPVVNLPKTGNSAGHGTATTIGYQNLDNGATLGDVGGWVYNNLQAAQTWGQIVINCTHKDLKGNNWSGY